jgi:hypothetical protein
MEEYKKAYEYLVSSFCQRYADYIEQGEELMRLYRNDPEDMNTVREIGNLNPKIALMRDIICFTQTTLERAKRGEL